MSKILTIVVIILILGGAGWFYFSKPKSMTETNPSEQAGEVMEKSDITIQNSKYSPQSLTVKAGAKVTVVNKDITGHSVTAEDGSFDTGVLSQGATGSFTAPTKPGTYNFHCTPHPSITGTLVVE